MTVTGGQLGAPIRAVVFDLYITLTDWDAELRRPSDADELASALGVDRAAFGVLLRATFGERVCGAMGDVRATFAELARRLGRPVSAAELDEVIRLRTEHTRRCLAPRAGVIEAVRRLRPLGYRTGVLSDCTAETASLWPSLPYAAVVDAVTFSCEIAARKPAAAGYLDVARKLGVGPVECLYVADGSNSELSGAAAVGMTPVLLETPFGADVRYDPEVDWAGLSVREIGDVEQLLRRT